MGNQPVSLSMNIPTYTATGSTGGTTIAELTFPAGQTPPTDGSVSLAFIVLNIPGVSYANNGFGTPHQRLVYFTGFDSSGVANSTGVAKVTGATWNFALVGGYSFVADANAPT